MHDGHAAVKALTNVLVGVLDKLVHVLGGVLIACAIVTRQCVDDHHLDWLTSGLAHLVDMLRQTQRFLFIEHLDSASRAKQIDVRQIDAAVNLPRPKATRQTVQAFACDVDHHAFRHLVFKPSAASCNTRCNVNREERFARAGRAIDQSNRVFLKVVFD